MSLTYLYVSGSKSERQIAGKQHRQAVQAWLTSLRAGDVSASIAAFAELKDDFRFARLARINLTSGLQESLAHKPVNRITSR